jgi:hypothetical protein
VEESEKENLRQLLFLLGTMDAERRGNAAAYQFGAEEVSIEELLLGAVHYWFAALHPPKKALPLHLN